LNGRTGAAPAPPHQFTTWWADYQRQCDTINSGAYPSEEDLDAAMEHCRATEDLIRETRSVEPLALAAKLKALKQMFSRGDHVDDEPLIDRMIANLEMEGHADDALLALGPKFERLWAVERAVEEDLTGDDLEAACTATGKLAHQIHNTSATTMAGFRLKARAVEWACDGDIPDDGGTYAEFSAALLRSLVRSPSPADPLADPAAAIEWLGANGVEVSGGGFHFPDGLRDPAMSALQAITPDQGRAILAEAKACEDWIERFEAAGGGFYPQPDGSFMVGAAIEIEPPLFKWCDEVPAARKPALRQIVLNRFAVAARRRQASMAEGINLADAGVRGPGQGAPILMADLEAAKVTASRAGVGMAAE
jgi:hypothetical protein